MSSNPKGASLIYRGFDRVITFLCIISPVEQFKKAAIRLFAGPSDDSKRMVGTVAIDVFITFKWLLLGTFWAFGWGSFIPALVIGFLLLMSNHTYFCYHLWFHEGASKSDIHRERRRFLNLGQAAAYSVFCFAYLYCVAIPEQFQWPPEANRGLSAILFSIGNSLTGFTGDAKPITSFASVLVSSQLVSTFVFIAILLSNSVPRTRD